MFLHFLDHKLVQVQGYLLRQALDMLVNGLLYFLLPRLPLLLVRCIFSLLRVAASALLSVLFSTADWDRCRLQKLAIDLTITTSSGSRHANYLAPDFGEPLRGRKNLCAELGTEVCGGRELLLLLIRLIYHINNS